MQATTYAEGRNKKDESESESQDTNIFLATCSDELRMKLDSDEVLLTDDLFTEQQLVETDTETEETSGSDKRFALQFSHKTS